MKAFAIDRYKSKEGGRIVDVPQPEVGDDDVLVQIHAAGVNLLDAKIADGEFKIFLPYRSRLFSATTWLALWSRWALECGASNPATRSMRDRIRTGSGPSQNSSP